MVISDPYSSPTLMLAQIAFPGYGVRSGDGEGEGEALSSLPDFQRSIHREGNVKFGIYSSREENFK